MKFILDKNNQSFYVGGFGQQDKWADQPHPHFLKISQHFLNKISQHFKFPP